MPDLTRASSLRWGQVWARRMARHGLTRPVPPEQLAEQVSVMGGVHAQVMSAAEVSISIRVEGITRSEVRQALWEDRSLVKAFGPRGTVHLLAARDLPTWNALLGSAIEAPRFPPDVRMDAERTDSVIAAIDDALVDVDMSLDELGRAVVERAGAWAGDLVMPAFQGHWPRWMQALRTAASRGVLCFGPNRGAKVTYSNPRRWLADYRPTPPDVAASTVLRQYMFAYGPARPEHFARWLGSTPAWAKDLFGRVSHELELVEVEGEELWQLAGDDTPSADALGTLRLLPYFDAYAVGSHPRERVFPGRAAERGLARTQAGNVPVLVIDGTVAGIWHQRRGGKRLALTVELFRPLSRRERRALDEAAERVGQIQEATTSLTIGTVTAGPHA